MYNSFVNFAVVKQSGKQYLVSVGDKLSFDHIEAKPGDKLTLSAVLLKVTDDKVIVGTPTVAGAKVTAEVLSQNKGPKIRIQKFKAKARYRRTMGFRAAQTQVQVTEIK